MQVLVYLLARFSEPSSYAGLGAVLALAGWNLSDTAAGQLIQLLAAGCGLLALVLKERGLIRAVVLVFAVLPALSGCTGAPAAIRGGLDEIAQTANPLITAGCGEYAKAKAAADAIVASGLAPGAGAEVTSVESFGDAACGPGSGPPAGDPLSTTIWLGQLAGQLTTLTAAAHS